MRRTKGQLRWWLVCVLVAGLAFGTAIAQEESGENQNTEEGDKKKEEQVRKLLNEARKKLEDGDEDGAVALWREVLAIDEGNIEARDGINQVAPDEATTVLNEYVKKMKQEQQQRRRTTSARSEERDRLVRALMEEAV